MIHQCPLTFHFFKTSESWIMQKPEWVEIFAPNGSIAEVGSIIKRPAYSKTLTTIANEGANAFYEVNLFINK